MKILRKLVEYLLWYDVVMFLKYLDILWMFEGVRLVWIFVNFIYKIFELVKRWVYVLIRMDGICIVLLNVNCGGWGGRGLKRKFGGKIRILKKFFLYVFFLIWIRLISLLKFLVLLLICYFLLF